MYLTAHCPCDDELKLLAFGNLPDASFDATMGHVESCLKCQERLATFDQATDLLAVSVSKLTPDDIEKARYHLEAEYGKTSESIFGPLFRQDAQGQDLPAVLSPPCQLGPYEIREQIGRGGMGEVYAGVQSRLGRPVAIKILRNNRQHDAESHIRFLKEMAIVGKLDHPNLVRAYDAWESNGFLYLVFELLNGKSLQSLADSNQIQTVAEVYEIVSRVLEGLQYLHSNSVIHQDIKPGNVIRTKNGEIKIIDFGLSSYRHASDFSGYSRVGTKGFMAPEPPSVDGVKDHLRDIYSTGALLSFLLNSIATPFSTADKQWFDRLQSVASMMSHPDAMKRCPNASEAMRSLQETKLTSDAKRDGIRRVKKGYFAVLLVACMTLLLAVATFGGQFLSIIDNSWRFLAVSLGLANPGGIVANTDPDTEVPLLTALDLGFPVPELVLMPPGIFVMGAIEQDEDAKPVELPRRRIAITKPFYIGRYEVTVAQYQAFVSDTEYQTVAERNGVGGWKSGISTSWGMQSLDYTWKNPGYISSDMHPVSIIAFEDAVAYCNWLSKTTGRRFRLPTEVEWEYVCRAGSDTVYSFDKRLREDYSWSKYSTKNDTTARPVGTRLPNRWGIHDMVGNVREWCSDLYSEKAYELDYMKHPNGPDEGALRVIRGAAYMDGLIFMRSSNRGYLSPEMAINNQGFRVVCDENPAE